MTLTPEPVAPDLWRLALPSRTLPPFDHTNSYLVRAGDRGLLVDLGAADPAVLDALWNVFAALGINTLEALLLTHTHPDHCAGVAAFRARFGAPVYVHPLEQSRLQTDTQRLTDDGEVALGALTVRALHTPGHSPGHLSFWLPWARALLVGDLLAAHGSTWVGVPEGDVSAYLASLSRLGAFGSSLLGPGHGEIVHDPAERIEAVRRHRLARETEVLSALDGAALTVADLRSRIYPGLQPDLAEMAERSLEAHLVKLTAEGRVVRLKGTDPRYTRPH